jgi:two-component system sensor histidine kinase BaeS
LFGAIGVIVVLSIGVTLAVAIPLTRREAQRSTLRDVSRQADLIAENRRQSVAGLLNLGALRRQLADQDERLLVAPLGTPSAYLSAADLALLRRNRPVDGVAHGQYRSARPVSGKALILLRPKRFPSRPYIEALALGGLAGAVLAAVAALLLARALARPMQRVAEASRRVGADLVPEHVPETGATELQTLARSFNEMAEQLRRARDAERSFLLSASHELKTPLTAIRGYAEALDEGAVSVGDAVTTIRLEAARLERLVRDLLDLARMNKAEFSFQPEAIDLSEVAGEVVRRYEQQARAFGIRLEASTNGPAPAHADHDRVLQVVSNLVENALRLVPSGGGVRVAAEPGELRVEDTGPGLRPDELGRAFERFYLYERYGKERPVGTGLGLAIVKQLVEGMGGSVAVESDPGRLTRFTVMLPPGA